MKQTKKATTRKTWHQILLHDLALVVAVAAADLVFGHAAALFSTVVALAAIMQRG